MEDIGQIDVERLMETELDVAYQCYSIAHTCRYWWLQSSEGRGDRAVLFRILISKLVYLQDFLLRTALRPEHFVWLPRVFGKVASSGTRF